MFSYTKKFTSNFLRDSRSLNYLVFFDSMPLREVKVIESATDIHTVINIDTYTVEEQLMIYPTVVVHSVKSQVCANTIIDIE